MIAQPIACTKADLLRATSFDIERFAETYIRPYQKSYLLSLLVQDVAFGSGKVFSRPRTRILKSRRAPRALRPRADK
ncbi:hypothetical protein EVAR_76722_1 [Eumeta japonica]|uniref:Uncharacterized protein n=1 Tax=Eumeta variegata TaxID=151549 RepID=A0A4C1SW67_EUMVA|nr:hypothetical protein EVAR_76722_1 [Eumeta japonica]